MLDSFNAADRRVALDRLLGSDRSPFTAGAGDVNMHFHSFFSFNVEDWSPTHIAWEARRRGLYAAGLCDFDVLDGLEDFIQAGLLLGLRTTVNLETRAYVREYADVDINSPGEPGVAYVMGAGFRRMPAPGSAAASGLAAFRAGARARNEALIQRINPHLPEIAVDYENDVLPLTPSGSATERHIIRAYVGKSKDRYEHAMDVATFWARILGREFDDVIDLLIDTAAMEEAVRAKLVKRGGFAYEPPSASSFPPVDDFIRWVLSCEAVPMITWLDGASAGEKDGRAMLTALMGKGAAALNIIPDRNWNIADDGVRRTKVANLNAIVRAADDLALPINIGTELNKAGQPFADDLGVEALAPHRETFLRGARIMVGHSVLLRHAGYSYVGAAAQSDFPDVRARNRFFEAVGALPPLTREGAAELEDLGPEKALDALRAAAKA
jgi:hypothetical protein